MEQPSTGPGLHRHVLPIIPHQLGRVMRLITLFLFIACIQVSANGYSQAVSFSGKDVSLQAVFSSFERQTGFSFFFNYSLVKDAKPVTLEIRNLPLEAALKVVLKDENLDFYLQGKTIFIVKKEAVAVRTEATMSGKPGDALTNVKGKVVNQQGEALAGATVQVKNGRKGTLTDETGGFELRGVPVGSMLEISHLGYQNRLVEVGNKDIRVEMAMANNKLDEVQVIAYDQTSQRLTTANITTVKSEDIEKQPVNNPILALEGRVPGLFITQTSGLPGANVRVRIQGQNSIGSGNDPLYVIDGVPFNAGALSTTYAPQLGGGAQESPFFYLNPNDIESIDILKDADATAIYGSRAANGAILISTKKGRPGTTRVDINFSEGMGKVTRMLKLLNSPQYMQMRHEAKANDNVAISASDFDLNDLWDTTRNTDWQKQLIGGTAMFSNASASLSGGTLNAQFLVSGTYHRETTVFPGSANDAKGSVHFSLNTFSHNQKLHFQLTANYLQDNNNMPQLDFTSLSATLPPVAPPLRNADGTLNWMPNSAGVSSWSNPLASLYNTYQNKTSNLIANAVVGYKILRGLEIKSSFGYNNLQTNEILTNPLIAVAPENRAKATRTATYTNSNDNSWIAEPQIRYENLIGNGKLTALVGATFQQDVKNGQGVSGKGYNSDAVLKDILSAASILSIGSIASTYRYSALFGRINYNWQNKYLVDLTMRRDGSSRFGPENQMHNFWSAGAAWVFSQEAFFKDYLSVISSAKLRGSYGTTGNDQIGDYQFMNLYTPFAVGNPYQGIPALTINNLPNPYLQWEETKKIQGGIEIGALGDRISFIGNYVYNQSSNQLLFYVLPSIDGFTSITSNFPATVRNTAWELAINATIIKGQKFAWRSGLNLTIPENKLVSFPNFATSGYSRNLALGQPISIVKAYHSLGADPTTGVYQFASKTNPFKPVFATDATVLISTLPRVYGGCESDFSFKGFDLSFLFQFVKQKGTKYFFNSLPGNFYTNQPAGVLKRWQQPGDVSFVQRFSQSTGFSVPGTGVTVYQQYTTARQSDLAYGDASYIRLKNLSLSWSVPKLYAQRMHLLDVRIYVACQNLLTLTKFKGMDPENSAANLALPPLRIINAGIKVGL